jgi:hypothetical protein
MDLFSSDNITNILPFGGVANYHGVILDKEQADLYYQQLFSVKK